MRAPTLIFATVAGMWLAPLGIAATPSNLADEEALLSARLNWQRTRIAQLQAAIRTLAPPSTPSATVPGDEALRAGLSAEELRAARGEPDDIYHLSARCEIWSYGTTRVTLAGNRIATWRSVAGQPGSPVTAGDPTLADEEGRTLRPPSMSR